MCISRWQVPFDGSMTEEGNIYILVPQANKEELKLTPYNREPQNQM
jgi:hypothetical protein